ncbi:hypothetical protein EYF80_003412 [Liparis tanakae]|uniref:Uncharacterized protein n=1 Tax=Liparis tanakae TaxID=230148 RepID=A0A4Z2J8I8_9TELE|nr:hypothetical protein EYF80_003412 [Liparis tanakae]
MRNAEHGAMLQVRADLQQEGGLRQAEQLQQRAHRDQDGPGAQAGAVQQEQVTGGQAAHHTGGPLSTGSGLLTLERSAAVEESATSVIMPGQKAPKPPVRPWTTAPPNITSSGSRRTTTRSRARLSSTYPASDTAMGSLLQPRSASLASSSVGRMGTSPSMRLKVMKKSDMALWASAELALPQRSLTTICRAVEKRQLPSCSSTRVGSTLRSTAKAPWHKLRVTMGDMRTVWSEMWAHAAPQQPQGTGEHAGRFGHSKLRLCRDRSSDPAAGAQLAP